MKIITASAPKVGIYWEYPKGRLISFSSDYRTVQSVSGYRDSPYDHDAYWAQVVKLYPELKEKEYFDIPRGRVIYLDQTQMFRLISDQATCGNKSLVMRICREFSILPQKIECLPDAHYESVFDIDD